MIDFAVSNGAAERYLRNSDLRKLAGRVDLPISRQKAKTRLSCVGDRAVGDEALAPVPSNAGL